MKKGIARTTGRTRAVRPKPGRRKERRAGGDVRPLGAKKPFAYFFDTSCPAM